MIRIPKNTLNYINREAAKRLRNDFKKRVEPRFLAIRAAMISEFLNHPITVEIKGGIDSSNISGTLGGYGNLFSFIGFEATSDPIRPILDMLESTKLIDGGISSNGTLNYHTSVPTSDDIFAVTDMPWAKGRSWAKGIETGISGIGQYIKIDGEGRSDGGRQFKKRKGKKPKTKKKKKGASNIRDKIPAKFKNTSYISALIKKYTILFVKL